MVRRQSQVRNLYALLVGINCYLPNKLPDGTFYLSLKGCVQDIQIVEQYLLDDLKLSSEHLIKLTATSGETEQPSEPPEQWPTYRNIVTAFARLTAMAQPGDQVYIHYSGHGGRVPTLPAHRRFKSLDEALVPTDIGNSEAQYLRDIELAYLLKKMVDKGLLVTIVLDSCHAGSATRGTAHPTGAGVRGTGAIDTTPRPTQSLVASDAELAEAWQALSSGTTRNVEVGSGWLLEPKGYVLLAACSAHEYAYEYAFNDQQKMGALTHWLLDSLKRFGPKATYRTLHQRILANVHSQFEQQTPQLEGEGDRVAFGDEQIHLAQTFSVMKVEAENKRILLNAGQAQGLDEGTQFAIYHLGTTTLMQPESRVAIVEIVESGATNSWAKITQPLRSEPIEQGDHAVLLDPGKNFRARNVRLLNGVSPTLMEEQPGMLKELENALEKSGGGFVQLASGEMVADYVVSINPLGEYVICDSNGAALPHLPAALNLKNRYAATCLVEYLVHLSKYDNARELENGDPLSTLSRQLIVELTGVQTDYRLRQKPHPRPFDLTDSTPTLKAGEWTFLRVRNNSSKVLNITVLNLRPDWAIKQIYPSGAGLFEPLDSGSEFIHPLHANLPSGYDEATDVIKVLATVGVANFHCLELPPLNHTAAPEEQTRGGSSGALDNFLSKMKTDQSLTRSLDAALSAGDEWAALQVEVRVK